MEPLADRPDAGPFVTAVVAAVLPTGLGVALAMHLPVNLITVVFVIVPVITAGALCVGVSMLWAFVVAGKKRQVRFFGGTVAALAVSMVVMLVLTVILLRYTPATPIM